MDTMSIAQTAVAPSTTPTVSKGADPAKVQDAAQQFESLLIGQLLESASKGGGWLGSGEDSASSCVNGFAQQQLATLMAKQGGLGLSTLIAQGLERGK
jgi:Rod binding domain-containing protein